MRSVTSPILQSLMALVLVGCGSTQNSAGRGDGGGRDAQADGRGGEVDGGRDGAPRDASVRDSGEAGIPCYANTDCVGGTCSYSATVCPGNTCSAGPACPGTCVPFAVKGGFCLDGNPPNCNPDSGLVCDPFSHVCESSFETFPTAEAGAPCGLGVANCPPNAFCYTPVFPDKGSCLPLGGDGGGCPPDSFLQSPCAGSLLCKGFGTGPDAGRCAPPAGPGASCVVGGDAGPGNSGCNSATLCVDGGCAALPTAGSCLEGQCLPDAGYCNEAGTCEPLGDIGAPCSSDFGCKSQLCASTTNTCVALLPLGATCGESYDCTLGQCVGDAPGCASEICDMAGFCATSMCPRPVDAGK